MTGLKTNPWLAFAIGFFFMYFSCYAQDFTITGSVKNGNETAIALANIITYKAIDTSVVKGAISEGNGNFTLKNLKKGDYLIQASYIENVSDFKKVTVDQDKHIGDLKIIHLNELEGATVIAKTPTVQRKSDRIIFNIENTTLTDGSLEDALKKTPGVIIIKDKLTIKGSGDVGVMINGKIINLPKDDIMNLLSGTMASYVESIEVITSPPAKYTAEGGMLINIKMSKDISPGYNGSFFNRYKQGVLPKHIVGIDNFFKRKSVSFSVNYSYTDSKKIYRNNYVTHFTDINDMKTIFNEKRDFHRFEKIHNANLFFDYKINQKNTLNISSLNSWQPRFDKPYNSEIYITDASDLPISNFTTDNKTQKPKLNSSIYLDYKRRLAKKGATLSLGAHYTYFKNKNNQQSFTDFYDNIGIKTNGNSFATEANQQIDLFNTQIDLVYPIGKKTTLEGGIRYALIDSESFINQNAENQNSSNVNITDNGNFTYNEDIFAAYTSFAKQWDKIELNTGIRVEQTQTLGIERILDSKTKKKYLEWFPSFSILYTANKKSEFNLYAFRRIYRPRYENINPYQYFLNNFTVKEGDPNLEPSIKKFLAFNYSRKNTYYFEAYIREEKNYLSQLTFQDNDLNIVRLISSNLEREFSYGLDFSYYKDLTNRWHCYVLSSYFFSENRFNDINTNQLYDNGIWSLFFRTINTFTFLEDRSLTADFSLDYLSKLSDKNGVQTGYNEFSIALRKTFWNNKASASLGIRDIFKQGNIFSTINYADQYSTWSYRPETRLLTLGFRYKFGNTNIKNNKKRKHTAERKRI
ncbi:outer membrane beta-barrel family protein [uncultured Maribacter sp.]|uniref:outer membrane beta-barrel family protein n=1 Tax=uncultured Maribacter sp. TaxID=431308 RepID=UPI002602ADF7|nr:outer membrane beta-barrel family protein [uncultured Maribacter sp.]